MKKKKVYLAKSNHANPNELIILRKQLNDLGVEVVEYEGGQYSNKSMLECEYLIVLPSSSDDVLELQEELAYDYSDNSVVRILGKGLYSQIIDFCDFTNFSNNVYIVYDSTILNNNHVFYCGKHDTLETYDKDDYLNYGYTVFLANDEILLTELFGGDKVQSSNQYMYLLAKR